MINLNLTSATRIGLNLLALVGIAIALYLGETIFIPLTIAVLLASILWPVVEWLNQRLRIPWGIACMAAVSLLVLLFSAVTLGFVLAVPNMLAGLPRTNEEADKLYDRFRTQVMRVSPTTIDESVFPEAERSRPLMYVKDLVRGEYVTKALLKVAGYLNSWMLQSVLILFVLLFLLMEGRMLTQRVVEIFGPSEEVQTKVKEALAQMSRSVRAYLVWRTIVNFGLALVLGIVYYALRLEHPWTWALLAAVLCYVPYIGTIIAGVPPVLDAFINRGPDWAFGLLLFYIVIVTFEGYIVVPVLMGRNMDLNATTVILSCLFWDLVWGTPGLFLAMPLMAALKAICLHVPGWRAWANLMGTDEGPLPPEPEPEPAPPPEPPPTRLDPDKTVLMDQAPVRPLVRKQPE